MQRSCLHGGHTVCGDGYFACPFQYDRTCRRALRLVVFADARVCVFPDCAVCSKGYTAMPAFTCNPCPDRKEAAVIAIVALTVAVLVLLAFVWHMVSIEQNDATHDVISRLRKVLPLQSIKTIVVTWQLVTQVRIRAGPNKNLPPLDVTCRQWVYTTAYLHMHRHRVNESLIQVESSSQTAHEVHVLTFPDTAANVSNVIFVHSTETRCGNLTLRHVRLHFCSQRIIPDIMYYVPHHQLQCSDMLTERSSSPCSPSYPVARCASCFFVAAVPFCGTRDLPRILPNIPG